MTNPRASRLYKCVVTHLQNGFRGNYFPARSLKMPGQSSGILFFVSGTEAKLWDQDSLLLSCHKLSERVGTHLQNGLR